MAKGATHNLSTKNYNNPKSDLTSAMLWKTPRQTCLGVLFSGHLFDVFDLELEAYVTLPLVFV